MIPDNRAVVHHIIVYVVAPGVEGREARRKSVAGFAHLAQPGQWNRLRGTLRGDRLTLALNGHELFADKQLAGLPARGPRTISPRGSVDFANIFVHNLSDAGHQSLDAVNKTAVPK